MPDKKKKKKKQRSRRQSDEEADEEEAPLPIERGEAEFAQVAAVNADHEAAGDQDGMDEEDAVPAPIEEPDLHAAADTVPQFTEEGLAVATAIDMSAEDDYIFAAIEYDPDSKPPLHKNVRFRVYATLAFVVVISVVTVVVVYVTKSAKGADITEVEVLVNGAPTGSPTGAPTTDREASGIREQVEAGILQRGANFSTIDDPYDPRYRALDWILHYDQQQLDSDDKRLYQRYVLALLAYALDSLAWNNCGEHRIFGNTTENYVNEECQVEGVGGAKSYNVWLTSTDECSWYGVICSSDDVVRGLELMGQGLIGEIPPEISQLRFLSYLAFNGNCLYGTIPPEFGTMRNLLSLELHGNGLSGELPVELYDASKLQLLNVAMQFEYSYQCRMSNGTWVDTLYERGGVSSDNYNNGLTGEVLSSNVSKWESMKGLHLFDNSFYGPIAEEVGELKYLVYLRAQNNRFWGMLPNGILKLKRLRELHLEYNLFYTDIPPEIGSMKDLQILRMGNNEAFGKIPESLYDLAKLKMLWLQDTMACDEDGDNCVISNESGFSGSISPKIGQLKKLSHLIINANPFTGAIPSEIGQCEKLAILHMHKTNIEGRSPKELCALRDVELHGAGGVFYSDCRPNNRTREPFFRCDCCSDCCDHTTQVCIADD